MLRVREPGVLGWVGWIKVSTKNKLVYKSTNHPATDVGLAALLRIQSEDLAAAKPFGGYLRSDDGWNERGRWCIRYEAPLKADHLYAVEVEGLSRSCLLVAHGDDGVGREGVARDLRLLGVGAKCCRSGRLFEPLRPPLDNE